MVTRGRALVVDDETNLCRILEAKLAKVGFSVVSVHDGLRALEEVRESDFDIILLDLILPKLDGQSVLAEILKLKRNAPVIVMTACENPDVRHEIEGQCAGYINKPFDLDQLVNLILGIAEPGKETRGSKPPESSVLFRKGQAITIEVQNGSGAKVFASAICDRDDQTLSVVVPSQDGQPLEVPPRATVRVSLATPEAYHSFTTHVKSEREGVLILERPGVIYRQQRRQHARSAIRIPLRYAPLDDEEEEVVYRSGETRDISAGGACIVVPEEVEPGEMLRIELRPKTEHDVIQAIAQVLRAKPAEDPGESGHVLGCRFTCVDETVHKLLES